MICSRLDKMENAVSNLDAGLMQTREGVEKATVVGTQSRDLIDGLRKSMSAFSKALFTYLRKDEGSDNQVLRRRDGD